MSNQIIPSSGRVGNKKDQMMAIDEKDDHFDNQSNNNNNNNKSNNNSTNNQQQQQHHSLPDGISRQIVDAITEHLSMHNSLQYTANADDDMASCHNEQKLNQQQKNDNNNATTNNGQNINIVLVNEIDLKQFPTHFISRQYVPLYLTFTAHFLMYAAINTVMALSSTLFHKKGLLSSALQHMLVISTALLSPVVADRANPLVVSIILSMCCFSGYIACNFSDESVIFGGLLAGLNSMCGFTHTIFRLTLCTAIANHDFITFLKNKHIYQKDKQDNPQQQPYDISNCNEIDHELLDIEPQFKSSQDVDEFITKVTDKNEAVVRNELIKHNQYYFQRYKYHTDSLIAFSTSFFTSVTYGGAVLGYLASYLFLHFIAKPGEKLVATSNAIRSLFASLLVLAVLGNIVFIIAYIATPAAVFKPTSKKTQAQIKEEEEEQQQQQIKNNSNTTNDGNNSNNERIEEKPVPIWTYLKLTALTTYFLMQTKPFRLSMFTFFSSYSSQGFVVGTFARLMISPYLGTNNLILVSGSVSLFSCFTGVFLSQVILINTPQRARIGWLVGIILSLISLIIVWYFMILNPKAISTKIEAWACAIVVCNLVAVGHCVMGTSMNSYISFIAYIPNLRLSALALLNITRGLGLFLTFLLAAFTPLNVQLYIIIAGFFISMILQIVNLITQWPLDVDAIQLKLDAYQASLDNEEYYKQRPVEQNDVLIDESVNNINYGVDGNGNKLDPDKHLLSQQDELGEIDLKKLQIYRDSDDEEIFVRVNDGSDDVDRTARGDDTQQQEEDQKEQQNADTSSFLAGEVTVDHGEGLDQFDDIGRVSTGVNNNNNNNNENTLTTRQNNTTIHDSGSLQPPPLEQYASQQSILQKQNDKKNITSQDQSHVDKPPQERSRPASSRGNTSIDMVAALRRKSDQIDAPFQLHPDEDVLPIEAHHLHHHGHHHHHHHGHHRPHPHGAYDDDDDPLEARQSAMVNVMSKFLNTPRASPRATFAARSTKSPIIPDFTLSIDGRVSHHNNSINNNSMNNNSMNNNNICPLSPTNPSTSAFTPSTNSKSFWAQQHPHQHRSTTRHLFHHLHPHTTTTTDNDKKDVDEIKYDEGQHDNVSHEIKSKQQIEIKEQQQQQEAAVTTTTTLPQQLVLPAKDTSTQINTTTQETQYPSQPSQIQPLAPHTPVIDERNGDDDNNNNQLIIPHHDDINNAPITPKSHFTSNHPHRMRKVQLNGDYFQAYHLKQEEKQNQAHLAQQHQKYIPGNLSTKHNNGNIDIEIVLSPKCGKHEHHQQKETHVNKPSLFHRRKSIAHEKPLNGQIKPTTELNLHNQPQQQHQQQQSNQIELQRFLPQFQKYNRRGSIPLSSFLPRDENGNPIIHDLHNAMTNITTKTVVKNTAPPLAQEQMGGHANAFFDNDASLTIRDVMNAHRLQHHRRKSQAVNILQPIPQQQQQQQQIVNKQQQTNGDVILTIEKKK